MKPQFVSAVATLFCCAILAIVGLFGYSRYKAAQTENAAFRAQLLNPGDSSVPLGAHMPGQLQSRQVPAPAVPVPSPQPAQP